jgi:hypothetical protein
MMFDFWTIIAFIVIFGFFGGVTSYLTFCVYGEAGDFRDRFHIAFWPACLFGLMNGAVGIAGAFAIQVLLLGMRFYDKKDPVASDFIYLSAICLIGGFAARSFLAQVSQIFAQRMKEGLEKTRQDLDETTKVAKRTQVETGANKERIVRLMQGTVDPETAKQLQDDRLQLILEAAQSELDKDPLSPFLITKAWALKRLNKLQEAIDELTKYIQARGTVTSPDKELSTALYKPRMLLCLAKQQGDRAFRP